MADQVAAFIVKLVLAGGGFAAVAYLLLQHLGKSWLSSEFDKRIKRIEHEQNRDIERLRADLTRSFDRRAKLHQREFEVLPDVWAKICDAYWPTHALVHPFKQFPDINRMDTKHLESFIADCDLADWQKDELRSASDKNKYYVDSIFWHRLNDCREQVREASKALTKGGIFMSKESRDKLDAMNTLMWSALTDAELEHSGDMRRSECPDAQKLLKEGQDMLRDIESTVRDMLWDGAGDRKVLGDVGGD